jgi:hypothetical protein
MKRAYPYTIDNIEFFLGTLFASTKENGGRPGLFDAAFLLIRYRTEYAMLELLPAVVRHIVIPIVYVIGTVSGKYRRFKDAPAPIQPGRRAGVRR